MEALATSTPSSQLGFRFSSAAEQESVQVAERVSTERFKVDAPHEVAPTPSPGKVMFTFDEASGRYQAAIVDPEGKVVRKIPTDEVLDFSRAFRLTAGAIFDRSA